MRDEQPRPTDDAELARQLQAEMDREAEDAQLALRYLLAALCQLQSTSLTLCLGSKDRRLCYVLPRSCLGRCCRLAWTRVCAP